MPAWWQALTKEMRWAAVAAFAAIIAAVALLAVLSASDVRTDNSDRPSFVVPDTPSVAEKRRAAKIQKSLVARGKSLMARERVAYGLRGYDAEVSALLRRGENCARRACLISALAPYERYVSQLQRYIKALYRTRQTRTCERAIRDLEEEVIRIGLLPRVIFLAGLTGQASAEQALQTWITASEFFRSEVSRTRARCSRPL